jgi:hypothetical protein
LNVCLPNRGLDNKNVAEKLMPDIFIEDDCESIGGTQEMTSTHKEFEGIDRLPNDTGQLQKFRA